MEIYQGVCSQHLDFLFFSSALAVHSILLGGIRSAVGESPSKIRPQKNEHERANCWEFQWQDGELARRLVGPDLTWRPRPSSSAI